MNQLAKDLLTTVIAQGMALREQVATTCDVCGSVINQTDGILDRCARIERGDFDLRDRTNDNIKADTFICQKCYLEDRDLCAFFNRIGRRVR